MSPSKEALAELSDLSKQLNEQTDAFNEVIEKLDAKLAAMKIGVSIWSGYLLNERSWEVEEEYGQVKVTEAWELGYCRTDHEWHIAVKKVRGRAIAGGGDAEWVNISDPIPLIKASRIVRVEAADHLDDLISEIKRRLAEFVKSIAEAKKIVSK